MIDARIEGNTGRGDEICNDRIGASPRTKLSA